MASEKGMLDTISFRFVSRDFRFDLIVSRMVIAPFSCDRVSLANTIMHLLAKCRILQDRFGRN